MGNYGSTSLNQSVKKGRVILCDGSVLEFQKPLMAAELMLDHPQQVVVEFRPTLSGKRPTPLPADAKLETRRIYLMVPMKRGKPASLSSEEIRRVLLTANSVIQSRSFLGFPMFARIFPGGLGGSRGEGLRKQANKEKEEKGERWPESELEPPESWEMRPEYLSRQLSGKGWKPSLDTITEKKAEKKVSHWLF